MNIKKKPIAFSRKGIDFVEVAPSKLKKELFCEYCPLSLTCEKLKDPDYPEDLECSFNDFCLRAQTNERAYSSAIIGVSELLYLIDVPFNVMASVKYKF